jgi:hypothetical protein
VAKQAPLRQQASCRKQAALPGSALVKAPRCIPQESELRSRVRRIPGYRYLVLYLCRFPPSLLREFRNLPVPDQTQLQENWASKSSRGAPPVPVSAKQRKKLSPWRPPRFTLAVAWILMDQDNNQARSNPAISDFIRVVTNRWGVSPQEILSLSYAPRPVLNLLRIRLSQIDERKQSRVLHQRQPGWQERRWWAGFGLDKASSSLQRQQIWHHIFPRMIRAMLRSATSRESSWALACQDACRLVHLRYPKLWLDKPDVVRKIFYRSPKSNGAIRPASR